MEYDEYYDLFVEDGEEEIELELDDTEVKPEQVKDIVPAYEPQTVYPDPGMTIGQVNIAAIPDPTAVKDISENGDHNVARYGTARVNVQPNLQTPDPVTPTKQQQTLTPGAGYDGLTQAVVEPIPSEYIMPAGKISITENDTDVDISQYAAADIAVPVPPGYIKPEGTLLISENGNVNVREFESANVQIPEILILNNYALKKHRVVNDEYFSGTAASFFGKLNMLLPAVETKTRWTTAFEVISEFTPAENNEVLYAFQGFRYNGQWSFRKMVWNGTSFALVKTTTSNTPIVVQSGLAIDVVYVEYDLD